MATADRKQREKERRRTEIIDAAEKLFFAKGYDNVSMDDIAQEAELSKGTLFVYFVNKEDLFLTIVLRGTEILRALFEESIDKRKKRPKQTGPNRAYFEFVRKYPGYYRMISYYQSGRFDPEKTRQNENVRKITELRKEIFLMLEDAVRKKIRDGTIRPEIKPVEAVVLMTVIAEGIASLRPDLQEALAVRGVTPDEFVSDVIGLECRMLANAAPGDEK
jgi:AcrR family transcriptional regulator